MHDGRAILPLLFFILCVRRMRGKNPISADSLYVCVFLLSEYNSVPASQFQRCIELPLLYISIRFDKSFIDFDGFLAPLVVCV